MQLLWGDERVIQYPSGHTDRHTERQVDGQKIRQTDWQRERERNSQTGNQLDEQKGSNIHRRTDSRISLIPNYSYLMRIAQRAEGRASWSCLAAEINLQTSPMVIKCITSGEQYCVVGVVQHVVQQKRVDVKQRREDRRKSFRESYVHLQESKSKRKREFVCESEYEGEKT